MIQARFSGSIPRSSLRRSSTILRNTLRLITSDGVKEKYNEKEEEMKKVKKMEIMETEKEPEKEDEDVFH